MLLKSLIRGCTWHLPSVLCVCFVCVCVSVSLCLIVRDMVYACVCVCSLFSWSQAFVGLLPCVHVKQGGARSKYIPSMFFLLEEPTYRNRLQRSTRQIRCGYRVRTPARPEAESVPSERTQTALEFGAHHRMILPGSFALDRTTLGNNPTPKHCCHRQPGEKLSLPPFYLSISLSLSVSFKGHHHDLRPHHHPTVFCRLCFV